MNRMPAYTPKQTKIINTAFRILNRKGLAALTTKNLAKALRVSEPAIYNHFANKNGILLGVLSVIERITSRTIAGILKTGQPVLDKVESVFLLNFQRYVQSPRFIEIFYAQELFKNDRKLYRRIARIMEYTKTSCRLILEKGKHEIRPDISPDRAFTVIMASMNYLMTQWLGAPDRINLSTECRKRFKILKILLKP